MSGSQQAVVLPSLGSPPLIENRPIPTAVSGSAIVKILATVVYPTAKGLFGGHIPVQLTTPVIPGACAVGRVHALGRDSVRLKIRQLVLVDFHTCARDDKDASVLQGYMALQPGSQILMDGEWRDGSFAEYAKFPLEGVYPLNEELLLNTMGYTIPDLPKLGGLFISAGGFYDVNVKAGDNVIVAPATGHFGGSAVQYALALGATVIAAGRNEETLTRMANVFKSTGRFIPVVLSGDADIDNKSLREAIKSPKGADCYIDFSPPMAAKSTHIASCIRALRPFGSALIMGGIFANIEIPYSVVMLNSLRIQGRYMYERAHAEQAIKLLESGLLKLGPGENSGTKVVSFKLKDVEKAIELAAGEGWGSMVILEPWAS